MPCSIPNAKPNELPRWNPVDTPTLTFEAIDKDTFPSIELAREALKAAGTMPCVMNAANEEAANAFLRGELKFLQIAEIVEKAMAAHQAESPTLEKLLENRRLGKAVCSYVMVAACCR